MKKGKVSVILTTAGEIFLQKTIDNIIEQATGEIEIIVFQDGYIHNPPLNPHPCLKVIGSAGRIGIHSAINASVDVSDGEYLMKLDAHCSLDKGFDEKLKADCEDNWICIPTRYPLNSDTWERDSKIIDYMYISPPIKIPDSEIELFWPKNSSKFWEWGFNGICGSSPREDAKELISETMTFQGSCWFMKRDYFEFLDGLRIPEIHWFEGVNLSCKSWLSGGKVITNKKTWYAHLHKGKRFGRGYYISRYERDEDRRTTINFWMNNKWHKQIHELKWLIERFNPPKWENWNWGKKWKT